MHTAPRRDFKNDRVAEANADPDHFDTWALRFAAFFVGADAPFRFNGACGVGGVLSSALSVALNFSLSVIALDINRITRTPTIRI